MTVDQIIATIKWLGIVSRHEVNQLTDAQDAHEVQSGGETNASIDQAIQDWVLLNARCKQLQTMVEERRGVFDVRLRENGLNG